MKQKNAIKIELKNLHKKYYKAQLKYDLYDERAQDWNSNYSAKSFKLATKWLEKMQQISKQIDNLKNKF